MASRELSTVFHNRQLRRNFLETLGWTNADFSDFQANLKAETYRPESLLLDLFVNGFNGTPDAEARYRTLVWWRERAPKLERAEWFLAAVGYAQALAANNASETLLVDFWERELDADNLAEALALGRGLARSKSPTLGWICWSHSVLEAWQQEGMGEAAAREERLANFFAAQGLGALFVPVTDPLGALVVARRLVTATLERPSVIVMPAFGNDKLVHANWLMKTIARYEAAAKDSA